MSLEIIITPEANNGKRISVAGSLDSNTAPQLQQSIDTEINQPVNQYNDNGLQQAGLSQQCRFKGDLQNKKTDG